MDLGFVENKNCTCLSKLTPFPKLNFKYSLKLAVEAHPEPSIVLFQ